MVYTLYMEYTSYTADQNLIINHITYLHEGPASTYDISVIKNVKKKFRRVKQTSLPFVHQATVNDMDIQVFTHKIMLKVGESLVLPKKAFFDYTII